MASEIEAVPCNMMLVERSYSTGPGWRLATFQEATDNLDMIKQHCLLKQHSLLEEWQTARLLDGWISGPSHNFQMGYHFRSSLRYMLLIRLQPPTSYSSGNSDHARSRYEDVPLTLKGREVALLLCVEDWNFEVLYWLLNFWEKKEPFNPLDVKKGKIPFSNRGKFEEMNRVICHMGRIFGEERLPSEKATRRNFSVESVKEVMVNLGKSCWDKFSQEHKKILGQTFLDVIDRYSRYVSEAEECSKVNWFQEFASQEDTSYAIWNFLWYIVSSNTLSEMVNKILPLALEEWKNEGCKTRSQRDFIMSTLILYHLSECVNSEMILRQACKDAAGDDRQRFNDVLKNASFSCYGEAGNYDVLNKILIFAVIEKNSLVVNKVLEWGAQPQANLGPDHQNMALYFAIQDNREEIVRRLFDNCQSKEQLANAANEEGMTALHWACDEGEKTSICQMIVEYGGRPDVGDNRGRLPLHYAVERENEDIVDVLIGEGKGDKVQSEDFNERRAKMVTLKDNDGVSALDMAIKNNNIKLMIKLLSVSQQALETYIDKVDSAKLLHAFVSEGNVEVVKRLLESGADPLACDERGQTALHHASMSENDYKANKLIELILKKCTSEEDKKKWVTKQDDMGKTALHVAALKGHERLCYFLLNEGHSLLKLFLNEYEAKYHHIFRSLAAMDSSGMFEVKDQQSLSEVDPPTKGTEVSYISCSPLKVKGQQSQLENDSPTEGSVPAILTVRYNAWRHRSESEALAGMVEEITKGIEGIMTDAQWLSTCFRNSLRKKKHIFWIEIVFPCILAILLAISFNWILWLVLDRYNIKEPVELKYASFPVALAISKKLMSSINPVSDELLNDIKLPSHSEKLGYQKEIISDITFLKNEIGKNPYWLCTVASCIRHFITGCPKYSGENTLNLTPSANLRILVFIDDLDRCQETIILQVLSVINLVLAVCEISVVLGMDKEFVQRAIMKRHGDKSLKNSKLADKYLQKIIQLPLDLPDPSEEQSRNFLDRHLGVFQKQSKEGHSDSRIDDEDESIPEIDSAYNDLFSPIERSNVRIWDIQEMIGSATSVLEANSSAETTVAPQQAQNAEGIAIDIQGVEGTREGNGSAEIVEAVPQIAPSEGIEGPDRRSMIISFYNSLISKLRHSWNCRRSTEIQPAKGIEAAHGTGEPVPKVRTELIPIRELLFVRYSEGERETFCHFQRMATDVRKLPREWKRFLTYHRLVWNIFIINNETKHLDGWQVQLITWIFICWEFEDNINILVKRWNEIDLLKTYKRESESGPSLREIVEHCIKKESWIMASNKSGKKTVNSSGIDTAKYSKDSENKDPPTQKSEEDVKEEDGRDSKNMEVPKSSNIERRKLKEGVNEGGECSESSGVAGPENLITIVEGKNDKLEKSLLMELDALKKEIKEEMKEQLDSLRKEISLLKEQAESQEAGKSEKRAEEEKLKSQSWQRLKSALEKYDVSMKGIQVFQRFRFYCEAGHLQ